MANLKEIKVRFTEEDIAGIDRVAQSQDMSRSEYIRELVTGKLHAVCTPTDFHRLVAATHRAIGGSLDPRQVESVVAFVVTQLLGVDRGKNRRA